MNVQVVYHHDAAGGEGEGADGRRGRSQRTQPQGSGPNTALTVY